MGILKTLERHLRKDGMRKGNHQKGSANLQKRNQMEAIGPGEEKQEVEELETTVERKWAVEVCKD